MRKTFLITAFALATLSFTSCKSEVKTETTTEATTETTVETSEVTYACPMDCEKGKMYDAPGKCPVCEMDLVENHEGHNH